jgi:hypothetical protein
MILRSSARNCCPCAGEGHLRKEGTMNDKLIITVREPDESGSSVNKALALVLEVCAKTNRTQQDVFSRMIEYAYDRLEIKGGGSDDDTENP